MIKLMGSVCVFWAGGMVWYRQRRERRRKRLLLAELAAALDRMETEIRMERTPLPRLFQKLSQDRDGPLSELFGGSARAMVSGEAPDVAWRRAVESLPLSEGDTLALLKLPQILQDDEKNACKGISLVSEKLRESLAELEKRRPEEEKRAVALCFSAAAMVVILLI